jgi:hypothetical protein
MSAAVPHHLSQASMHVVQGSSVVVPLRIEGLPDEVEVLGERWRRKLEFHLTAISARKIELAGPHAWEVVTRLTAGRSLGPLLATEEVRRVRHPDQPELRTLIVMVRADGLPDLYEELAAALQLPLAAQPAHVTLYSSDPAEGIGIDDHEELADRAPALSERDQGAIREAISFEQIFFDDGGIAAEPHDPWTISLGHTDSVFTPRTMRAIAYAEHVHSTQRRKGGEVPYLAHLLAVASLVAEEGGAETEVIGALLHDTAEDHGGEERLADVRRRFGPEVEEIVRALSDSLTPEGRDKEPWAQRKRRYLDHLRAEHRSGVLRVSNADKLHNARSILSDRRQVGDRVWERFQVGAAEQLGYYRELAEIFTERRLGAPLARELTETVAQLDRGTGPS